MRETLAKAGYDVDRIEDVLKANTDKRYPGKEVMDLTRPTYIKLHRKHLSPRTLDLYELPWEWDDVGILVNGYTAGANTSHRDSNYLRIKRWIP